VVGDFTGNGVWTLTNWSIKRAIEGLEPYARGRHGGP
jgi:hypothetical protein